MPKRPETAKKIICTVTNDLTYDQRMMRICTSLAEAGYEVILVGRERPFSIPLKQKSYQQKRLKCFFQKGKLFYFEYNIRLLFYLLSTPFNVVCSIDLDTILPGFIAAKIKNKPIVYDAHEYFAELPEVVHRPLVKKAWKSLERWVLPKIKYAYTINHSFAEIFKKEYSLSFEVIPNFARLKALPANHQQEDYILYQGSVNVGRGVEEAILAMQEIDTELYICGLGDVYTDCKELAKKAGVENKVKFFGYVEPHKLWEITVKASIGLTLFNLQGMSHYYSLANRFSDYIHAGVPQVCMNYPEYKKINDKYEVALLIDELTVENVKNALQELRQNKEMYNKLRSNCFKARQELNWENEEKKLLHFYEKIFS